eukprot:14373151-Alexandrium_andersonii.AAC.1
MRGQARADSSDQVARTCGHDFKIQGSWVQGSRFTCLRPGFRGAVFARGGWCAVCSPRRPRP